MSSHSCKVGSESWSPFLVAEMWGSLRCPKGTDLCGGRYICGMWGRGYLPTRSEYFSILATRMTVCRPQIASLDWSLLHGQIRSPHWVKEG